MGHGSTGGASRCVLRCAARCTAGGTGAGEMPAQTGRTGPTVEGRPAACGRVRAGAWHRNWRSRPVAEEERNAKIFTRGCGVRAMRPAPSPFLFQPVAPSARALPGDSARSCRPAVPMRKLRAFPPARAPLLLPRVKIFIAMLAVHGCVAARGHGCALAQQSHCWCPFLLPVGASHGGGNSAVAVGEGDGHPARLPCAGADILCRVR